MCLSYVESCFVYKLFDLFQRCSSSAEMENVVDIINRLQDVFAASDSSGIDLPQIVVVGAQSAGKSSVLENIVGKSFLPRGTGIVTRCPLVLQLVHTPDKKDDFATFQHNKNKVFLDYDSICKEIEAQTAKIAGKNKGVCSTSINLKIHSPRFLNLTLVDLPGLTKVPVGDQPENIEEQIRKLILSYIDNPNSIILAVSAANVDLATSESLKLAKQVDPEGKRTLAVLTKLDLMDDGTDAWEMLSGKVIPVKLGIVGVVNRSQKDILDEKSVIESLKNESEFFNKTYKSIASSQGTPYLRTNVQSLLINHIKNCMPKLKESINDKIMAIKSELDYYALSKMDKQTVLLDLVSKFSKAFVDAIKGNLKDVQTKELYGGARINYIFQESFTNALNDIDPLTGLDEEYLLAAMRNASGVSPTVFVDGVAFEIIVKKQILKMLDPSIACVNVVFAELNKIAQHCLDAEDLTLDLYPNLKTELDVLVREILDERLPLTKDMVKHFIDVQASYINSAHPDFMPEQVESDKETSEGEEESSEEDVCNDEIPPQDQFKKLFSLTVFKKAKKHDSCVLIQELIERYFYIIHKMVLDTVPKFVMHFMINSVVEHLHNELLKELLAGDLDELLLESSNVMKKRKSLEEELERLEEATNIINNVSTTLIESSSPRSVNKKSSFFNKFF